FQGKLKLQVRAHRDLAQDDLSETVNIPILEATDVERETGQIALYAPESMELIISNPDVVGAQPANSPQQRQSARLALASVWEYNRRPVVIPVEIQIKPTRLVADVATSINVKEQIAEVTSRINYQVQYAGVDTFRFAVPEAIADLVQIRSLSPAPAPSIKQKSRAEQAVDGWVTWTIITQRNVQGPYTLEVRYDITPGLQAVAKAPEVKKPAAEGEKEAKENEDAEQEKTEESEKAAEDPSGDIALKQIALQPLKVLGLEKTDDQPRSRN
ncbi:MAG: hypothetical protein RLO18_10930, partial [Gimesia chilikensis]